MKTLRLLHAGIAGLTLALALARTVCAQDFTLTLQPNTVTLIPDQGASFLISMSSLNGFTSQVALAVGTLPSGVTARFSPSTLTPPGTSILTLSADTNAQSGSFTLNISAGGGGITNTIAGAVNVNFGLLPICAGTIEGQVTDIQTGLPVPGARVDCFYKTGGAVFTDTNGMFVLTNLTLSNDNQPAFYTLTARATNYWYSDSTYAYAVCDATNRVNLRILRELTGSISGQVVDQDGGALAGVTVQGGGETAHTDTNGFFQLLALQLGFSNAPAKCGMSADATGYWSSTTNAVIQANSNTVVTLVLVQVCSSCTVRGKVFFGDTGLPAAGVSVAIDNGYPPGHLVLTDTNGDYTATQVSLGFDNRSAPVSANVTLPPTGYYMGVTKSTLTLCGETLTMPVLALQRRPQNSGYGDVTGHVYDVQTGKPITNAAVSAFDLSFEVHGYTDTNGAYYLTHFNTGTNNTPASITASASAYWESLSNVVIYANEVVTQDLRLLPIGYGAVMGTVRDSASSLPVPGASISVFGHFYTADANGHYASAPLPLSPGNLPASGSVSVSARGYWPSSINTTITPGNTNVADINLIQVCSGATIVGTVVDALTQKPITNATVVAYDWAVNSTYTDTHGNFILTNISVGNDNSPIQSTISASAPGYNTQSKTVTIFCDATITVQFGAPQTAFGLIEGRVTNMVSGLPLAGAFVGSQFGESTYTDTNGFYQLTQAPLGANNSSRTWNITAIPTNFTAKTLPVAVFSNGVSKLNFGFGEPTTALSLTVSGAPNPVTVGSNILFLVTLTNTVADAQQVRLSDALPLGVTLVSAAITNSPGTPFSAPVYSNHVVTVTAAGFGSNSAVSLAIVVTPTVTGTLTNIATVTSSTADLDPTGSNRTATVITSVVGPMEADLALILTESAGSMVLGGNVTYTLLVTNLGPADAPGVVLDDTMPAGAAYVSSTTSQGTATPNGGGVHWDFGLLSSHAFATATLVVAPSSAGTITNSGTVTLVHQGSAAADTNQANNSSSVVANVTAAVVTNVPRTALIVSASGAPNPATVGSNILFLVTLTNTVADAQQVRLSDALPLGVTLVSAAITNSPGTPFSAPIYSNNVVTVTAAVFGSNSAVTLAIVVTPTVTGMLTNIATVTSPTADLDPTGSNRTATVITSVVSPITNLPPLTNGPITFNPQTGLYQQSVSFVNLSGLSVAGVRVTVLELPSSVALFNATGSTNGAPFVEYDQTIAPGGSVVFLLEYYDAGRQPLVSTNFVATVVAAAQPPPAPSGPVLQLDRVVFISQGQLTIEFASVPGQAYVVQYSTNSSPAKWQTAVPPIIASGTKTQWIDSGPPKTDSAPGAPGQRYYRVVQITN